VIAGAAGFLTLTQLSESLAEAVLLDLV
jgi:hypothetical protein